MATITYPQRVPSQRFYDATKKTFISDPQECASGLGIELHAPELVFPKDEDLAVAAEAEVGDPALDLDLADEHPATAPDVDAVAAAGVDVAEDVALDPVGGARVRVGEDALVRQEGGRVLPVEAEGVDRRGAAVVRRRAVPVDEVGVRDVEGRFVGREGEPVGAAESIGHHADVPRARLEAVDLLRQLRPRAEPLLKTVDWVGEPDTSV